MSRDIPVPPPMRYAGIWSEGKEYQPGHVATHSSALWVCTKGTKTKPGDSADWHLLERGALTNKQAVKVVKL